MIARTQSPLYDLDVQHQNEMWVRNHVNLCCSISSARGRAGAMCGVMEFLIIAIGSIQAKRQCEAKVSNLDIR